MNDSRSEATVGAAAVVAGLGAVTMALFPFALPFAILLGVALVPLLPVAIAGGLLAAVIAVPVLAVRALRRRRDRRRDRRATPMGAARPRPV